MIFLVRFLGPAFLFFPLIILFLPKLGNYEFYTIHFTLKFNI